MHISQLDTISLDASNDPGLDGYSSGPNKGYARDAFGMYLGYHEKDFVKSLSVMDSSFATTSSWHVPNPTFLYNGNISSWASNTRNAAGASIGALASVYHYDLLNRIRTDSMRTRGVSAWDAVGGKWHSAYTYDGNGNIQTLYRKDDGAGAIDNLTYTYTTNKNTLTGIDDLIGAGVIAGDLDDQADNNYAYDATGNLTQDVVEGINTGGIVWTPYNKIRSITQAGDAPTNKVEYLYDASGNRVLKRYYNNTSATLNKTTWYVRDASGNVLGTYTKPSDGSATLSETPVYGSSRVAVARPDSLYSSSTSHTTTFFDQVHDRTLGHKDYELTDHLGNVRTTVTDVLIKHSSVYDAEISTYTDYYPFGMQMPLRTFAAGNAHRYGYNGKENDNDVKADGGQQDYGFRIYDPRVARFLSVDPLASSFAFLTPYQFAANTPIQAVDLDGLEALCKTTYEEQKNLISVTRFDQGSGQIVRITHSMNNIQMFTDLSSNGPRESELNLTGLLRNPSILAHYEALMAGKALADGSYSGGNSFGSVAKYMARNAGLTDGSADREKYENTFLHFLGSAFLSTALGEQEAKYVADIHERDMTNYFSESEPHSNSDAYEDRNRDLVNNEWGRKFGTQLREKYGVSHNTKWDANLVANIVNDVQQYMSNTFGLSFTRASPNDPNVAKFTGGVKAVLDPPDPKSKK